MLKQPCKISGQFCSNRSREGMGVKAKLLTHQPGQPMSKYGDSEFIFNCKELSNLALGDVVEIYHPDEEFSRLLLPVSILCEDFTQRESVSVESSVAKTFHLKAYSDVIVNKVDPKAVALDMVELCFREQYISRSDMWRMKKFMLLPEQRCMYLSKKIEYCAIRCTVSEMWSKGERVACGVLTGDSRVVLRSNSAMVFIFIQMSTEMWESDTQGDLYFEKCVNGFLPDLFHRWQSKSCAHYTTIVVFSRWFYDAKKIDEFPLEMRTSVLQDFKGRFYQDFYRVIVQNEHYDDWFPVLHKLKPLLREYPASMTAYFESFGPAMPKAHNCKAEEGNFLETINMSLNVFVKHNIDRNFERTGQMPIVITPGTGIFVVDREFANLTKQRVIDCAVSLDLVCLGEQPLHAVPLFIFQNRHNPHASDPGAHDYNIPWWMNYSYYNPVRYSRTCCKFIPRIKVPEKLLEKTEVQLVIHPPDDGAAALTGFIDFDKYDRDLFNPAPMLKPPNAPCKPPLMTRFNSHVARSRYQTFNEPVGTSVAVDVPVDRRKNASPMRFSPQNREGEKGHDEFGLRELNRRKGSLPAPQRHVVGSAELPSVLEQQMSTSVSTSRCTRAAVKAPSRAHQSFGGVLINPFKPAEFSMRKTSDRRRWIHVFPTDSKGNAMQSHHYMYDEPIIYRHADASEVDDGLTSVPSTSSLSSMVQTGLEKKAPMPPSVIVSSSSRTKGAAISFKGRSDSKAQTATTKTQVWAWGVTGEEQWNPDIQIGVDWKGLTLPACLPLSTDFFPDTYSLQTKYEFAEQNVDLSLYVGNSETIESLFDELINQRLQQGFQIISSQSSSIDIMHQATMALLGSGFAVPDHAVLNECYLSINRIYHWLVLAASGVSYCVKFRPVHLIQLPNIAYQYQFQTPDSLQYESSSTRFKHEQLEMYKWSRLDHFVLTKGQQEEYALEKDMKCWEARFVLLPNGHPGTKRIIESVVGSLCDKYDCYYDGERMNALTLLDNFVKFLEILITSVKNRRSPTCWRLKDSKYLQTRSQQLVAASRHSAGTFSSGSSSHNSSTGSVASVFEDTTAHSTTLSTGAAHLIDAVPALVLAAIMNPENNFGFFVEKGRFPEHTFVAAELIFWIMDHVADINSMEQALTFCQTMLLDRKICHVSNDPDHPFVLGFYLYYIVTPTTNKNLSSLNLGVLLEVKLSLEPDNIVDGLHRMNMITMSPEAAIAANRKLDRAEWLLMHFGSQYTPTKSYHFLLQWLVATASNISDMVSGWCRKANQYHFHLIAMPLDPFALPSNPRSDPLRCPVFVPVAVDVLSSLNEDQLLQCQTAIVLRFGFLPLVCDEDARSRQFIHLTGGMFTLIPDKGSRARGFRWSWNFMLDKRYRSATTGDESFQDRMLADFRLFCSNDKGRLTDFVDLWRSSLNAHS